MSQGGGLDEEFILGFETQVSVGGFDVDGVGLGVQVLVFVGCVKGTSTGLSIFFLSIQ